MKKPPRRWLRPDPTTRLLPLPGRSALVRRILATRGFQDPEGVERFFGASLIDAPDPFGLRGMKTATDLLDAALTEGVRIAIYGDYDADGITATAILTRALRGIGADIITYIPNRFSEGYGVNNAALGELYRRGARLVVTCDCGTNSTEAIAARPADLQLIVVDHHECVAAAAPADAVINPKQPGCDYPFKGLAACGVAYKLLTALRSRRPELECEAQLDLLAIGTVADLVPLEGENRSMVAAGLKRLAAQPTPGTMALMRVAEVRPPCNSAHLAFALAPRLNAAGRMQDAQLALDLLLAEEPDAQRLAEELNAQNVIRQGATQTVVTAARAAVESLAEDEPLILLANADWPQGIVGLAAGRLVEEFQRPAFVVSLTGEEARGSARSIEGFHLVECLKAVAPLLTRFGGHAMAAGFSLRADRLPELHTALRRYAGPRLSAPGKALPVDAIVELRELTPPVYRDVEALGPFGLGNREPLLMAEGLKVVSAEVFGAEGRHLRVQLRDETARLEAIAFERGHLVPHLPPGRGVDALFALGLDAWNGLEKVCLELRDLRSSGRPVALSATPA